MFFSQSFNPNYLQDRIFAHEIANFLCLNKNKNISSQTSSVKYFSFKISFLNIIARFLLLKGPAWGLMMYFYKKHTHTLHYGNMEW